VEVQHPNYEKEATFLGTINGSGWMQSSKSSESITRKAFAISQSVAETVSTETSMLLAKQSV
jgi:hypothetical protein